MGRKKRDLKYIENNLERKACEKKRLMGLLTKCSQFTRLIGTDVKLTYRTPLSKEAIVHNFKGIEPNRLDFKKKVKAKLNKKTQVDFNMFELTMSNLPLPTEVKDEYKEENSICKNEVVVNSFGTIKNDQLSEYTIDTDDLKFEESSDHSSDMSSIKLENNLHEKAFDIKDTQNFEVLDQNQLNIDPDFIWNSLSKKEKQLVLNCYLKTNELIPSILTREKFP